MLCDLLSWVRRTTVRKDLTVTSIIITSLLFFISCHICSSWYSSFHIIRKPLHQSPTCFLFVLMMLSLWHSLHCSHHTFTHPLSVHYFLPLLLLILPLLLHTNRTAQSIADFFPNHENHDSILCSLIFSSNDLLHNTKLYSQSKYTCFSILGSKNHSIQSNADIFPSHVSQVFFLLSDI